MNWKHIFIALFLFASIYTGVRLTAERAGESVAMLSSASPIYSPSVALDTITDTEADTILIPGLLYSKWAASYTLSTTQNSGTQDLTFVLQESPASSGGPWVQVGTKTTSGASDVDRIEVATVYGVKHRVIVTGTGTQETAYDIDVVMKKD